MSDINWDAIRKDHEQGLSLRTLATRYGISKSSIGNMLSNVSNGQHGHEKHAQTTPSSRTPPTPIEPTPSPVQSISLNMAIAQNLIRMIARHVAGKFKPEDVKLDPKEMKLLADTLSQCNKIMIGEEVENNAIPAGIDWGMFTFEELTIIQPLFERALARKTPENVTAFRKQA